MLIKKWSGRAKLRSVIIMAVMTKEMLINMNISSDKANDFIRDNNNNMKENREFLKKCKEITKMFGRK
ncbi:hypothetical protein ACSXAR_06775 [Clostridium perfringens]